MPEPVVLHWFPCATVDNLSRDPYGYFSHLGEVPPKEKTPFEHDRFLPGPENPG